MLGSSQMDRVNSKNADRYITLVITGLMLGTVSNAQTVDVDRLEENKRIARAFYDDLWFSNNTDNYGAYVADFYVVHDIGDRKNITEPAVEQKNIADFFWKHGTLSGRIIYQVADGDLVATRWISDFEPETLFGRFVLKHTSLPIINVLRIDDGKIVEFWNHRHDIDTAQTLRFTAKGLLIGLLIALIPLVWGFRLRSRLNQFQSA